MGRDRKRWGETGSGGEGQGEVGRDMVRIRKKGAVGLNKTIIRSVAVGRNRAVE